mgnify:CR=1 FL=1
MGIYIDGMEMPTKGYRLILVHADGTVQTTDGETTAVPVPPHGNLIDAGKLVELCDIMANKCDGIGVSIWHQFKTTVEWSPIVIKSEEGET